MSGLPVSACGRRAAGLAILVGASSAAAGPPWSQFARGPAREALLEGPPPPLSPVRWVRSTDGAGNPVVFAGQSGVVTDGARVYAVGRVLGEWRAVAFRCADGGPVWTAPVPAPVLESWSTPAVEGGVVYVAAGRFVTALAAGAGGQLWQTQLDRVVVNASPLITTDRGPADRLFITDYDAFGGAGRLYCINVDPLDAASNPFVPGQVVWSVGIGGTSGNTPAYAGGVVFVSTVTDAGGLSGGLVLAFDAGATSPPPPLWAFENPGSAGFFGGVCAAGGSIYAASYEFSGGQSAANLVKLDAASGVLSWSVPCNRTNSTPIPLPGGLVAVSGGIVGFGCVPSIQLFHDDGGTATMLWDSALSTWNDTNGNLVMDPGEYLLVGGWTHQPVGAPGRLIAGAIPAGAGTAGACTDLYTLDLTRLPGEPGFIVEHVAGAGTSPAADVAGLYTVGAGGLYALGTLPGPPCAANCDGSTTPPVLNVADFSCFLNLFAAGDPAANCDGSTTPPVLNVADFSCFLNRFAVGCS